MGRNVEPSSTEIVVGNSDALDTVLSRHNLREAQQQATQLSKAKLEGRRKIFDRFAQDDELNKNRLNRWLNHTPIFPGRSTLIQNPNYNKSRKRTSDTDTAAISSDAEDVDPGTCSRVENNKKRKTIFQGSRCVVCTKVVGAESAAKVMTRCPTCNVFLCAIPRGRNKHSCWVKWHSIAHLDQLVKVRTVTPPTRSSPRRNVRSSPRIRKRSRRMSSADC